MRKFYLFIILSIIISSCSNYTQSDVIEYEPQNIDTITNNDDIVYQLAFIEIKCGIGARKDLGRPTISAKENKNNFMKYLQSLR